MTSSEMREVVLNTGWLKRDTEKAAARVAEWSTNKEPVMSVHEYVDGYEFRGDQDYTPNDHEKALIEDAIHGYLGLLASAPAPATGGVDAVALLLIAEAQVRYWNDRQRSEKALEDATDEDGNYTPIGDGAAWSAGYCNGRYSEADWWLKTISASLTPAATPVSDALAETIYAMLIEERLGHPAQTLAQADKKVAQGYLGFAYDARLARRIAALVKPAASPAGEATVEGSR